MDNATGKKPEVKGEGVYEFHVAQLQVLYNANPRLIQEEAKEEIERILKALLQSEKLRWEGEIKKLTDLIDYQTEVVLDLREEKLKWADKLVGEIEKLKSPVNFGENTARNLVLQEVIDVIVKRGIK